MARRGSRAWVARFAAPAAFLAAATVAVLLVRAGLDPGDAPPPTTPTTISPPLETATVTFPPTTEAEPRRFYVIRSGDTLDAIAARFDTTVEELLLLNPDVEPTSLRVGQRLRVA